MRERAPLTSGWRRFVPFVWLAPPPAFSGDSAKTLKTAPFDQQMNRAEARDKVSPSDGYRFKRALGGGADQRGLIRRAHL